MLGNLKDDELQKWKFGAFRPGLCRAANDNPYFAGGEIGTIQRKEWL